MNNYFKYFQYIIPECPYYKPVKKLKDEYQVEVDRNKWFVDTTSSVWKTYIVSKKELENQGWKIHISTQLDKAEDTLKRVSSILIKREIPFKHAKSKEILMEMYSKTGDRINAGKFITIYPGKEEVFLEMIKLLYEVLCEFPEGPYVLTDKQVGDSNVYFRYGAYKKILSLDGKLCIFDQDGNLIPDERKPHFELPVFVKEPKALTNFLESISDNSSKCESRLNKYKIEDVIRYSNSGGIYIASRVEDGIKCVIKEARPNVGFDGVLNSATDRLENEYKFLKKVQEVSGVVRVLDYFQAWKHTFLVEEYIEGQTYANWIAQNYPFSFKNDLNTYSMNVIAIIKQVIKMIDQMQNLGVAMGDLQTQNIMITEKLQVRLIDFELAREVKDTRPVGMETKGFVHPLTQNAGERDWYALSRILQYSVLPIGPVGDLEKQLNMQHYEWIRKNFKEEFFSFFLQSQRKICNHIKRYKEIFNNDFLNVDVAFPIKKYFKKDTLEKIIFKLYKGILENCDVESAGLINGDIRQYEMDCGDLNVLTGGFGAILAMSKVTNIQNERWCDSWIKKQIPRIIKDDYNNGLLTGKMGIAIVLYKVNYCDVALNIINRVIEELEYNTNNFSLRSGLSGIGLALISLHERNIISCIDIGERIAERMCNEYDSELVTTDWDSINGGLIDGNSGIAIFLSYLYKLTKKERYKEYARKYLLKDVDNMNYMSTDGSLQLYDKRKHRYLPYLANGSIGVGIAIWIFNLYCKEDILSNEIEAIKKVNEFRCCYDAGLFDGAGGFFLLECLNENDNSINKSIERLKLFAVDDGEKIKIPGKFSYKLSSDLYSGTSGILLAIQAAKQKKPLGWLPIMD